MAPKHTEKGDPASGDTDGPARQAESKVRKKRPPAQAQPAASPQAGSPQAEAKPPAPVQGEAGHGEPGHGEAGHGEAGHGEPGHPAPLLPPDARKLLPVTVEDLHAPEFFASEAQSISLINGMISIAFASSRYDYSESPSMLKNVVVSRVVMTPACAQNLAVRLFGFLDQKGFSAVPKDPKLRQ